MNRSPLMLIEPVSPTEYIRLVPNKRKRSFLKRLKTVVSSDEFLVTWIVSMLIWCYIMLPLAFG